MLRYSKPVPLTPSKSTEPNTPSPEKPEPMVWTPVVHVKQLPALSRWRKYQKGLKELLAIKAPTRLVDDYRCQAAKFCFLAFADLMLGGNLQVSEFHELIASAFEDIANGKTQRFILSCPPRSGKSLFSQLLVAWLLGKDPDTQHIIASYFAPLSHKFFKGTVGYLNHKKFKKIFPRWKGFKNDSKYDMVSDGYLLSTSVGGGLTGFTAGSRSSDSPGVGAMVIDDPLKNSFEGKALARLKEWWDEEASTRRTNRWAQILIGTRFHVRDLHGLLMEADGNWDPESNPGGWRWLNIPGICDNPSTDPLGREAGQTHWPDNPIFTATMLQSQKKAIGSNKFAALYQGLPVASEGALIKGSWLRVIEPEDAPSRFDITYLALDTAFKEKEEADESAISVLGFNKRHSDQIFLRSVIHGRWTFPDLISIVKASHTEWDARFLCVEDAASGQSLIQVLEREAKIRLHCFKPTQSKTTRLQTVAPLFENGQVKFIKGEWTDSLVKELLTFPHCPHDDKTDALVWGLHYFILNFNTVNREYLETIRSNTNLKSRKIEGFRELTQSRGRSWKQSTFKGYTY